MWFDMAYGDNFMNLVSGQIGIKHTHKQNGKYKEYNRCANVRGSLVSYMNNILNLNAWIKPVKFSIENEFRYAFKLEEHQPLSKEYIDIDIPIPGTI